MTDLSPAGQAVLDAYVYKACNIPSHYGLAAALRAAADHINHDWSGFNCVDALYEIAAELEGSNA
jgi:hypothetical protein